jgi:hypothetical protein
MKFIAALNAVNSQVWAFLVISIGGAFVLAFHKAGIDVGIAAGIIGAGVNMFTSSNRNTPPPPPPDLHGNLPPAA